MESIKTKVESIPFFDKPEILFNKEQNYTGRERASTLTTETKQEGPNPTSKEPK